MWHTFLALLVLSPILLIVGMVYGVGRSSREMVIWGWALGCLIAWLFWRMELGLILAATARGLWMALVTMFFLIIAIVLGRAFRETQAAWRIRDAFSKIHPDRRVQAVIIAGLFAPGIDSILGFGASGGVSTMIMAGIGFPPACAVLMTVMGMAPASAFTLMGTPIEYGVGGGLQDPFIWEQIRASGVGFEGFIRLVTARVGLMHGVVGVFQPLLMVMAMTRFFGHKRTWLEGISIAPFALFAGLAFYVPFAFTAIFLGPAFPSLVGSIVSLAVVISAVKMGFLMPRDRVEFLPQEEWRSDWAAGPFKAPPKPNMPLWKGWLPYGLLAVLIVASRISPVRDFLRSLSFSMPDFLAVPNEIFSQPLYMPSTIHILVIFICMAIYPLVREHLHAGTTQMFVPIASIFRKFPFAMALASVYMHSGINNSDLPSMPRVLAEWLAQLPGSQIWCTFLSPFVGAIAIYSPESSMFANLELSAFQYHLGESLMHSPVLFVALQVAGSSTGTMIAFNYIAGSGVYLGMLGWESPTFRRVLSCFFIYLTLLGILGVVFANFVNISRWLPPSVW